MYSLDTRSLPGMLLKISVRGLPFHSFNGTLAGGWHSCAQEKGVHFLDSLPSSPHACLQCGEVQAVLPPPFWGGTERGLHVLKIRALSHLLSNSDGYFQS